MKNCGFTMVELIVVVAILGVLAAILIPTLLGITIGDCGFCEYHSIGTEKADRLLSDNGGRKPQEHTYGEDYREVFTISVVDGTWYIDAAQNPSAFSPDTVTWGNAATVTQATNTVNSQYGEELLGMYLRDVFPTISNGVIKTNCIKACACRCGTRPIRRISPI
ncbi:MAG: type II secretion system protein [[Eubacterium] siraeum]